MTCSVSGTSVSSIAESFAGRHCLESQRPSVFTLLRQGQSAQRGQCSWASHGHVSLPSFMSSLYREGRGGSAPRAHVSGFWLSHPPLGCWSSGTLGASCGGSSSLFPPPVARRVKVCVVPTVSQGPGGPPPCSGAGEPSQLTLMWLGKALTKLKFSPLSGVVVALQPSAQLINAVRKKSKQPEGKEASICEGITRRLFPFFSH